MIESASDELCSEHNTREAAQLTQLLFQVADGIWVG